MKQLLSISLLIMTMLSCKKSKPDFNEPMTLSVHEDLQYGSSRHVILTLETERSMTCGSALIEGESSISGDGITVNASGIRTPPNCMYSPRRVTRSFDIGEVAAGTYALTINNGNYKSTGSLVIDQQRVSISLATENNVKVVVSGVMRVPDGTIWGNVMYATPAQAQVADSFTAELEGRGATTLALPDGEYHYFTIRDGVLTIAYNGVNLYANRKDFLYHYTGITDSLQPIATDYSFANPQANFFIRTWDGRNFNYPGPPVSTL